jgi:hypothetical protein
MPGSGADTTSGSGSGITGGAFSGAVKELPHN